MQSLAFRLVVAVAFVSFISLARAGVSLYQAKEGEKCKFPDGAVGRCEKMIGCLRDKGVVKRNGNIVICATSNSLDTVSCCRRPHLVAEKMCLVWARYWRIRTPGRKACTSTIPLIGGGEEAVLGEFPNMAALGIAASNRTHPSWICGGSLITPSFVLTAAHCVSRDPETGTYVVGLGEHDLAFRLDDILPRLDEGTPEGLIISEAEPGELGASSPIEQLIDVAEIITHPEFQQTSYHDIALLRLKRPAVLTSRVLPACLPTRVSDRFTSESTFTAAGWGNIYRGLSLVDKTGSQKLQKVSIKYIGAVECGRRIFNLQSVAYPLLGITTDMICAGDEMKDTCKGDSGGPLMQKAELPSGSVHCQPEMVRGVVSFGPVECDSLGVYTRVSAYIDWITGIVAPGLLPAQA